MGMQMSWQSWRAVFVLVCVAVAVCASALSAYAQEKRIALVIGNQAYDDTVGVLKNPHNDIAMVAAALKTQGFEVLPPLKDARRTALLGAVRELAARLRVAGPGAIGFLYYSGHGAGEKDTSINYLIPVDAKEPGSPAFWDDSVKLDDVLKLLDGAPNAVKFVVFDACRNELRLPTRDTSKGLMPVAEQQGYFIAYASAPGRTATDRGDGSGPYAAALAKEFARQGLDHLNLFQNVKEAVIAATGGVQHPWESNGLTRRVYLTGEPSMPAEIALWESVRGTGDITSLQRFRERFPNGVFSATAAQMIERLEAEAAQRKAAAEFEVEQKTQQAKQLDEMRRMVDEAKAARDAAAAAAAAEQRRQATQVDAKVAMAAPAPDEAASAPDYAGLIGSWGLTTTSENCNKKKGGFVINVGVGKITVDRNGKTFSGAITTTGSFEFQLPADHDSQPIVFTGKLANNSGAGGYRRVDGRCWGKFTAKKIN